MNSEAWILIKVQYVTYISKLFMNYRQKKKLKKIMKHLFWSNPIMSISHSVCIIRSGITSRTRITIFYNNSGLGPNISYFVVHHQIRFEEYSYFFGNIRSLEMMPNYVNVYAIIKLNNFKEFLDISLSLNSYQHQFTVCWDPVARCLLPLILVTLKKYLLLWAQKQKKNHS